MNHPTTPRCGAPQHGGDLTCERDADHDGLHAAGSPLEKWTPAPRAIPATSHRPNTALGTASWLHRPSKVA